VLSVHGSCILNLWNPHSECSDFQSKENFPERSAPFATHTPARMPTIIKPTLAKSFFKVSTMCVGFLRYPRGCSGP